MISLLDLYRTICFYGGGAKVTQQNGTIQYFYQHFQSLPRKSRKNIPQHVTAGSQYEHCKE